MDTNLLRAANLIGRNATLLLRDVKGQTIIDVSGRLWITQQGDPRDTFLECGERFTFDRQGAAVVQAIGTGAAVAVIEAPALAPALAGAARPARQLAVQARSALGRAWDRLRSRPAETCMGCAS